MQRFSTLLTLPLAAVVAIGIGGCGGNAKPRINGAGATFIYP